MQQNEQLNQEKVPLRRKAALLWRFLKGSKGFFVVSMLTTALAALMDMLTPQIVRMAVDNVVGNTNATYADWIMALVNKVGGFAYLRQNLWILALAVALVALVISALIWAIYFLQYSVVGSAQIAQMRHRMAMIFW